MRRFRFRLQSLENIKGMEVDNLHQQLAEAQARLRKSQEELIAARDALSNTYSELTQLRQTQTDPIFLLSLEGYTSVLRQQITTVAQRIAEQKQELAESREQLVAKHKEKKVLEKYRERQHEKYSQYVERMTQKELDEAAQNVQKNLPI